MSIFRSARRWVVSLHHFYAGSVLIESPGHASIRVSGKPPALTNSGPVEFNGELTIPLPRIPSSPPNK